MDKLIALIIIVLSFSAILNLQAFAQNVTFTEPVATEEDTADAMAASITALITSAGTLIGTIGSIIGVIIVFIRDGRTKQLAQQIGVGMVTFGQKTNEANDRIYKLTKAGYTMSPEEAKKFLADNKMKVDQLAESVNKGNEQLQVIKDNLPGDTTAKISKVQKGLPTESFDTRPGVV